MNLSEFQRKWHRLRDPRNRLGPEELPFPTAAQLDLLTAALLPADQAAPAWRRWKARGLELETVERDSIRMFSQLWNNRDAAGIGAEDLPLLKGVYRHVLASNAGVLADALDAAQLLNAAGIPALLIKGAALIARTGRLGLRLIDDVDLLIPEIDAQRAVELLTASGYVDQAAPGLSRIGFYHSWDCRGPRGSALDVHWWAFKTPGDDQCMFDTARETALLERQVLIPSATESLISAVGNGFSRRPAAPMRWIADALLIFDIDGEGIEWDVLLERARRPGLTLSLMAGLGFLARTFGAPVPVDVLDQLRRRPVPWRERAAHWVAVEPRSFGTELTGALLSRI